MAPTPPRRATATGTFRAPYPVTGRPTATAASDHHRRQEARTGFARLVSVLQQHHLSQFIPNGNGNFGSSSPPHLQPEDSPPAAPSAYDDDDASSDAGSAAAAARVKEPSRVETLAQAIRTIQQYQRLNADMDARSAALREKLERLMALKVARDVQQHVQVFSYLPY
ncbi:hypothetical protein BC830DRAFT_1234367 [Chytriomyces sp. MP71]|nr:hypothetical protein BC830DRAFT_1234367 [Chytriomyces sp. MP71]